MSDGVFDVVTLSTALACGLIAGVFFSFSAFVMKALAALPPSQGISAMQSINRFAITPLFMTALFGTAAACVVLIVAALSSWPTAGGAYVLGGALLYVVGAILVTIVFNVPRNDALAAARPDSAEAARLWSDYVASWTAWNHVRTISALAAATLLTLALQE